MSNANNWDYLIKHFVNKKGMTVKNATKMVNKVAYIFTFLHNDRGLIDYALKIAKETLGIDGNTQDVWLWLYKDIKNNKEKWLIETDMYDLSEK